MRDPYTPVGAVRRGVAMQRLEVAPALVSRVAACFELSVSAGECGSVSTMPEGCADLFFDLRRGRAWFSGPRLVPRTFTHAGPLRLIGVQLQPGVAALLSRTKARALVETQRELHEELPWNAAHILRRLHREPPAKVLNEILLSALGDAQVDNRVRSALELMHREERVTLQALAEHAAASERNLTRLFLHWIGINPRRLARILRFQKVIELLHHQQAPVWAKLALDLGYADQSHLIRDFTNFTGTSPSRYLAQGNTRPSQKRRQLVTG